MESPALACEAQVCFTAGQELAKPWNGTAASQFMLPLPSDLKHDIPAEENLSMGSKALLFCLLECD